LETVAFKKETISFIDSLIYNSSSSKDRIYIEIYEDILCIIFVYKKDQETYEDILQLLRRMEINLGSQTQICAGIGSEAFSIEELRDSFNRALDAFCSRISVKKSIVLYKHIENLDLCGKCYSAQEINMLVESYINGNLKMSYMILNRIVGRLQNKRMSYSFFNELNFNLMNTLQLLSKEYSFNFVEKPEIKNLIYKLIKCKSIDDVNDMFCGLFGKIIPINPASEQTKAELLSKKIDNIISEAYNDKTLCIKKIAGELHYEGSYIRRVYKSTRNRNILQTIDEIRMAKAVELIKKGTYRIQDIASMVGFSDQLYFSKKFKLYFGSTPSEFENHNYMIQI
jgi:two-component system response regulator YesN